MAKILHPQPIPNAFSLVELSIVLVILGLLTGGILSGQSLIKAAELRAITSELETYQTAFQSFKDKYVQYPGEMTNATQFWGTAVNCPGTESQPSTDKTTCNGNGDGQIANNSGSNEPMRVWQHLANAGLIEGSYSGVRSNSSSNNSTSLGVNIPRSKYSQGGWFIRVLDNTPDTIVNQFAVNFGNRLIFGKAETGANADQNGMAPILSAEELWNIDTKIDDGKPAQGKIFGQIAGGRCANTTDNNNLNADYNLLVTGANCIINVRNEF